MDKFVVKNLILFSLILGLILGVLTVVPFVGMFMLFAIMFFTAPIIMLLLIMAGKFDITDLKNSIIAGAITGFSANITYAGAFSVATVLLYMIAKYNPNFFLTAMIINAPIWLLIICILFIGVVTATTNAFSGMLTYYIINFIRDSYARRGKNGNF